MQTRLCETLSIVNIAVMSRVDALTFGRRLRHHRKRAGLTLQQLGEKVSRPAPYLSMLENGRREPQLF